ncbi:MAG: hypothetical protein JF567_03790 [Xanthomonadales bacterium]|nr:hypothetical protein [Xanthomonadales bacterium]
MSDRDALVATLDGWRQRWPEWQVAETFIAGESRDAAVAWFMLLGELAEAAWGGSDPTPGLAKLGWWQEELRGWAKGLRRHPLGLALQKQPVEWSPFADSLGGLRDRDLAHADEQAAATALASFLVAISAVERQLFGEVARDSDPLQLLRTLKVSIGLPVAAAKTRRGGPRPRRVFDALAMARANAARKGDAIVLSRWLTLVLAWRAARGR